MFDRLEDLLIRLEEIMSELSEPSVVKISISGMTEIKICAAFIFVSLISTNFAIAFTSPCARISVVEVTRV